MTLGTVWDW